LAKWAACLAPAILRVGGTEADRVRYGFKKEIPPSEAWELVKPSHGSREITPVPPPLRTFVFKKKLWKRLCRFASQNNLRLLFTLGAGPESRDARGRWVPDDALRLLSYSGRKKLPVFAWEFGNEVNAFPFLFGLKHGVSAQRYSQDFAVFADLVHRIVPGSLAVGPSSAIWPLIGEPHPIIPRLCKSSSAPQIDALSFHYYPQQSSRGPFAVRRARENTLFSARVLNGAQRWVNYVRRQQAGTPAANAPLWITETGHALYGGEPGVSDTWLSTPWWLDQLGLLATAGVERVFRQALVGSDYGLLDEKTYEPRSDFYASFLWKKLIGTTVFPAPQVLGKDRKLRAWHLGGQEGRSWVLLINLNLKQVAQVELSAPCDRFLLLEPDGKPRSAQILLNGQPVDPELATGWNKPRVRAHFKLDTPPHLDAGPFSLPPLSCAFLSPSSP
jgi:heparanase 1